MSKLSPLDSLSAKAIVYGFPCSYRSSGKLSLYLPIFIESIKDPREIPQPSILFISDSSLSIIADKLVQKEWGNTRFKHFRLPNHLNPPRWLEAGIPQVRHHPSEILFFNFQPRCMFLFLNVVWDGRVGIVIRRFYTCVIGAVELNCSNDRP